ncbi:MAG: hypothetical protein GY940_29715, partial [bacterium]|nr:hypothetical protein [bacterium]
MKLRYFLFLLAFMTFMILTVPVLPQADVSVQAGRETGSAANIPKIQRLVKLCKIWGKVKYFHPYLAYKDIDWDAALVEALPSVYEAQTGDDFAAAVKTMLSALGDPLTTVQSSPDKKGASPLPSFAESITSETKGEFLVVTFGLHAPLKDYADYTRAAGTLKTLTEKIPKARGLLFDFRVEKRPQGGSGYNWIFKTSGINRQLFRGTIYGPGERERFHFGFRPQVGMTSGSYHSGFQVTDPEPMTGNDNVKEKPIVFLANADSELPGVAFALQAVGKAVIISEGPLYGHGLADAITVKLTDSAAARIRTGEPVHWDGSIGVRADLTFPASGAVKRDNNTFKA